MEVASVGKLQDGEDHLLVLREQDGERLLPITIGRYEAHAILRATGRAPAGRPGAHDLLASVIARLGGTLERVLIHDLREDTFFSQLELVGEHGLMEVDCRTSDAVALAVRLEAPIFATREVVERAAVLPRHRAAEAPEDDGGRGRGAGA
jgi:bifunctional DNase/RNase